MIPSAFAFGERMYFYFASKDGLVGRVFLVDSYFVSGLGL
jgi:hypothetical protein